VIKDYEQANGVGIIGKLFGCMQEEHENNQNLDKMHLENWKAVWCSKSCRKHNERQTDFFQVQFL
jgi:hypothetical protein